MLRLLVLALSLFLLPATGSRADDQAVPYAVDLLGVEDEGLVADIKEASRLFSLAERPPPGIIALRRRADEDRDRVDEVLRSHGYYDGKVAIAIDEQVAPAKVTVRVEPGPPTRLQSWSVEPESGIGPAEVGLELDGPAVAADVVKAEGALLRRLAARSHPLAKVEARQVVVDHASHAMRVTERIEAGPFCRFAAPTIGGLTGVDPDWVRNRVPWRPGDPFDPAKIEALRKALSESGLFRTIHLAIGQELDAQGLLPVVVELAERPGRSVGAGLVYSTAEGPGAQSFWEDRNLFGAAERLRLTGLASRPRYLALADYRAPDYFGRDKDLLGDLSYEQLNSEAFYSRTESISGGVGWRVSPVWTLSAALALEHDTDHQGGTPAQAFDLASLPVTARRDTTDSILDPTTGGVTTFEVRPYVEVTDAHRQFTRLEMHQTEHFTLLDDPRTILAFWGDLGSYLDSKTIDLPADKRFYAGGGGSVRGYRLRYAGALNSQGQPAGGRSLLGFGSELRLKVTDSFGVAPFFEGANVYATPRPQFAQRLFLGTGLGLRYYTSFAPLRLDFAVPLHRRAGIDDAYEIYVSLGQAF